VPFELFTDHDLRDNLDRTFRAVVNHIDQIRPDRILSAADQEIIEGLLEDASANCPELLVDKAEGLPVTEFSEAVGEYGDGRLITRQVPRWRIVVPFTGDSCIFRSRPSQYTSSRPSALDVRDNELELFVDGRMNPIKIRRIFDAQIEGIQKHLAWAQRDCEWHNGRLRADVPGLVRQRREQVNEMRETQAKIGFTIRHRGGSGETPVPLAKRSVRRVKQEPSHGSRPAPRWILEDSDYEEALRVLRYWRDSLERAPSIVDGRGEEEIRDLLLAGLNGVFEGAASGEVFNGDGRTDILIRYQGVNVFIGECKLWDGEATLAEALDQIFRYAVWRDTKTAVLLFIRRANVSSVIEKSLKLIRSRENFISGSDEPTTSASQYNFVMHAVGDPQQQIRMAFIPFAFRPKSDRPGRS
jgi:hypothetical protein